MRKKQADRLQYSWWTEGVIEEEIVILLELFVIFAESLEIFLFAFLHSN